MDLRRWVDKKQGNFHNILTEWCFTTPSLLSEHQKKKFKSCLIICKVVRKLFFAEFLTLLINPIAIELQIFNKQKIGPKYRFSGDNSKIYCRRKKCSKFSNVHYIINIPVKYLCNIFGNKFFDVFFLKFF